MAGPTEPTSNYLRWLYEVLFSICLSFLIISAHEEWPVGRWGIRLVHWGVANGYLPNYGLQMEDYRVDLADFLLVWVTIILLFLSLRLIARLSLARIVLSAVAGAVAIAGYPLTLLYTQHDYRMPFLYAEVAIAAAGVVSEHVYGYLSMDDLSPPRLLFQSCLGSVLQTITFARARFSGDPERSPGRDIVR